MDLPMPLSESALKRRRETTARWEQQKKNDPEFKSRKARNSARYAATHYDQVLAKNRRWSSKPEPKERRRHRYQKWIASNPDGGIEIRNSQHARALTKAVLLNALAIIRASQNHYGINTVESRR